MSTILDEESLSAHIHNVSDKTSEAEKFDSYKLIMGSHRALAAEIKRLEASNKNLVEILIEASANLDEAISSLESLAAARGE